MKLRGVQIAVIVAAAGSMLLGCGTPHGEWRDESYTIAGGNSTGVYYRYGKNLAASLSQELGIRVETAETNGSVDNLLRIGAGEALIGFAQGDAAADARAGTGAFAEPLDIQAAARLYDEYVHVVVRAESDIHELADLSGQTVSLGAKDSGVNVIATRILHAAGVAVDAVDDPQLGLDASIEATSRAKIDGFFWVGGLPTPGIERLASRAPLRLIPIDVKTVNRANAEHAGVYRSVDFPVGTYELEVPTPTMTVPNYLVTSEDVSDGVIYDILTELFEARSRIARDLPAAALLDRRQAIFTDPIALHPGAIAFYNDLKY